MNQTASCFGLKAFLFRPTTSVVITAIGVSIFNAIFAVTATIGNGLMLYILATKPHLKSPSNLLLASLCVTDFLVGLIVQPLHVVSRIYEIRKVHLCTVKSIYAYFAFLCSGASFLNMMLISMDRCYAVCFPFRYAAKATVSKYSRTVVLLWLSWGAITMLPFISVITPAQFNKIVVASAGLAIVVIVFCYSVLFSIARKQERRISTTQSLGTFDNVVHVQRKKEKRISNTMAIVVSALFLCYTPNLVCSLLEAILGFSLDLAYVAWHWTGLLVFFNSSLNPVLYCVRNRDIRKTALREIRRRTVTINL